jgi:deaminated glutathione amidase
VSDRLRVALVQLNAGSDKNANLARIERYVGEAADAGARLVALPEYVTYLGPKEGFAEAAEPIPGPTTERFSRLARKHGIYLLGGSIHEQSGEPDKYFNTSTLFDPYGELIAAYRKIHLFDVRIGDNVVAAESERIVAGEEPVTAEVDGHRVGFSICYDLRFPELYRSLAVAGAEILFVPAAFTLYTGKDHWHLLLRARAVENQCFVLAPDQIGPHEPNARSYGHSLVVDPWGTVLADAPDREAVVVADLDFADLRRVREEVPSLANRRPAAYERQAVAV